VNPATQFLPDTSIIEVFKGDRLMLICHSHDWRTFLPGVSDTAFTWRALAPIGYRGWSWRWLGRIS
jgi:hypothetical protein